MKAKLQPVYFKSGMDTEYSEQLKRLRLLLTDVAEIIDPVPVGSKMPDADAVLFPQLIGDAYRQIDEIKGITCPILIITSEFGTVKMWDWEIARFFKTEGCTVFTPYNIELTRKICRTFALKREMKHTNFVVYQDNPGKGFQADIFKRFFWWEDICTDRIKEKFGVSILKKSYKEFADRAKKIADKDALTEWKKWNFPAKDVSEKMLSSAVKIYLQLKKELALLENVGAMGMNCLNESHFSDTTPCLAWAMLYENTGTIWGCEADTMSMLTKYLVNKALNLPVMMSNVYPFLVGQAALKHEKIADFPEVLAPENHLLVVHCGYFGVLPKSFAEEWVLRPKVLAIVDKNSIAIDARLPVGEITLTKLDPTLNRIFIAEGLLEDYAQFPGSDCRNGAVIRVKNGYKLMDTLYSHHAIFIPGHHAVELELLAKVMGLTVEIV